jgi:hypothetical protein
MSRVCHAMPRSRGPPFPPVHSSQVVFSTGPLWGTHWLMGIPWFLLCFVYDESRKALMRK